MKPKMIKEHETTKYRIMVRGQILTECPSYESANGVVIALPESEREHAVIVPITNDGKQVLLG